MKNKNTIIIIGLFIIMTSLVGVIAVLLLNANKDDNSSEITNFQECIDAGNPAMESYPRQCRAGDQTFVEEIEGLPLAPPDVPEGQIGEPIEEPSEPSAQPPGSSICEDQCGDGVCQEIVCLGTGCPCGESATTCSIDCST